MNTGPEPVTLGALSFTLEDGALRHIRLGEDEVLRGIAFLVRDRDWGTLTPDLREVRRHLDDRLELELAATFRSGAAQFNVAITIRADADGLSVTAKGQAADGFETNRAGFTVLHPASLAGAPVTVRHSDGRCAAGRFPLLIDPWQPFKDIAGLTHVAGATEIDCDFEGDVFEMEDQRQWGDASFKTYCRPLALPWPYLLPDGAEFAQAVHLSWRPAARAAAVAPQPQAEGARFPDTAIVLDAADARRLAASPGDLSQVAPQRLLCHVDTTRGGCPAQFADFGTLQRALPGVLYDLELICGFDDRPAAELPALRRAMDAAGFRPDSVMICPAADRQSTPPGSPWPDCPPLEEVHAAAAQAFADMPRGGGMVSFFPELNRKRPPVEMLDFVSHGLCPIIHAADDLSVMETLEAVPHITRSARAIIGARAYRIGPATIAMRQNPYGGRTLPNPGGVRMCMTDDDPRHRSDFGAAYAIGLAAALAPAGVAVWTPAALFGPRGLTGPIIAALAALSGCAGQPVHQARIGGGLAELAVGGRMFRANLTDAPLHGLGAYGWSCDALPGGDAAPYNGGTASAGV